MYVRWLSTALRAALIGRDDIPCIHAGPGRQSWAFQVIESYREYGVVHKTMLWSPRATIRSCCAVDPYDPLARARFWAQVAERADFLKSTARFNSNDKRVLGELTGIFLKIMNRVPMPSEAEGRLYDEWCSTVGRWQHGETFVERYQRRLAEAREQVCIPPPVPTVGTPTVLEALSILGVGLPLRQDVLKKAFRQKVFETHPDRPGGDHYKFLRIKAAYEVLAA